MPAGEFVARRIENICPHVLRAPESLQIFVDGALSATLVGIHRLRNNLRRLTLDAMPRGRRAIVTRIASTKNSA